MNMKNKQVPDGLRSLLNERGIAAINGVFMAVAMAVMAGVAIDYGHALVTQNELQNASDAAALAAARQLGVTYLALPIDEQQDLGRNLTGNEQAQISAQATAAARMCRSHHWSRPAMPPLWASRPGSRPVSGQR